MFKLPFLALVLFSFTSTAQVTQSLNKKKLPLYEIGAGIINIKVPHYPASNHYKTHTIPFPTFLYRGEVIRADEDGGVRGRLFSNGELELNISFGGSLPADSKDNPDRAGMPDLDLIAQAGPSLVWHLHKSTKSSPFRVALITPLRLAVSTDFKSMESRGFIFNPTLFYIHQGLIFKKLIFFSSIDTQIASRRMHDYFYSVPAQFGTTLRPTYFSKGGYLGTSVVAGLSYLYKNQLTMFSFLYHSNHEGAANENSPLFKRKNTTSVGLGFVWWFHQSEAQGVK